MNKEATRLLKYAMRIGDWCIITTTNEETLDAIDYLEDNGYIEVSESGSHFKVVSNSEF